MAKPVFVFVVAQLVRNGFASRIRRTGEIDSSTEDLTEKQEEQEEGRLDSSLALVQRMDLIGTAGRSMRGSWMHVARPQLQDNATASRASSSCNGHTWQKTGRVLGKGANGIIFEVDNAQAGMARPQEIGGQKFALKQALTRDGESDVKYEVDVMKASARCRGVMNVVDAGPCLYPSQHPLASGFVAPLMIGGDLYDWLDGKDKAGRQRGPPTPQLRLSCGRQIFDALHTALGCFHNANHGHGYMHGDLKEDNVMYDGIDSDGCPTGLKLADFGLTQKLDSRVDTFAKEWYTQSGHLPGAVFEGSPAYPENVRATRRMFLASRAVDMCSLAFMMINSFGLDVTAYLPTDCGMMGGDRLMRVSRPAVPRPAAARPPAPAPLPRPSAGHYPRHPAEQAYGAGFSLAPPRLK